MALENVFQFACGLSDEGAMKILQRLKLVRISDPTLDLSNTIPDEETETDVPLCDVTYRHEIFSDLVNDSFREVQSKAELLSHFLDCTGGVILVTRNRLLSELMPNVNVLTKLARNCVFIFFSVPSYYVHLFVAGWCAEDSVLYKSLDFLNCLQTPLRVTDTSDALTVEDFLRKFRVKNDCMSCNFHPIVCFQNGQFQFCITELSLSCHYHARVFTESTTISIPSNAASLCSDQLSLKFLSSLDCANLSSRTVKALGAVIANCKHLSRITVRGDDSVCCLLEQVRNPSKCCLRIDDPPFDRFVSPTHLSSLGAVQLASLLPRFKTVMALNLDLRDCCAAALDTLVPSITRKTLERLILKGIILTPAVTKALGQSLPGMSSLEALKLTGVDGIILPAEEMEALFGRFNKTMPLLKRLTFSGFNVRGCLAPLIKSLLFFPNLRKLKLVRLNIDEHDQYSLLESFGFRMKLEVRIHEETDLDFFHCDTSMDVKTVVLGVISLTPTLAAMLGRLLPEMSSLQVLELTGVDGSTLQAEEMEALFGGFSKTMPSVHKLIFVSFNVRGRLSPLFRSLRFFPNLLNFELR